LGFELNDRMETTDGSRPDVSPLSTQLARTLPLNAFTVLAGGDVFEAPGGAAPRDALAKASAWFQQRVRVERHGAPQALVDRVQADVVAQLKHNPVLVARLMLAKPIVVDLVPPGGAMTSLGFPSSVGPNVSGLYWDQTGWEHARVALRQDRLPEDPVLTVHEFAHAIHYLAFTQEERESIYKVLRPTFGSRSAMDEVFAIYSEREFLDAFPDAEKRAPGVYGFTRRQWNEGHLFTRFVRKLYTPHKPLAGPRMASRKNPFV